MYHDHWGLREAPFGREGVAKRVYKSPGELEALARLHYLVDHGRRLGLLLGDAGSGKSTLLAAAADEFKQANKLVARFSLLGLDAGAFLWQLAASLGLNPEPSQSPLHLWCEISDELTAQHHQQRTTVLLLDDAGHAQPDVIDQVTRLARTESGDSSRLTLVLATCCRRLDRLGWQLLDLTELRVDLQPWDQTDTVDYLQTCLREAGRDTPVFGDTALDRLHALSRGVPRRINQLAEHSLMAGAGAALEEVDAETVETVYQELGVRPVAGSST